MLQVDPFQCVPGPEITSFDSLYCSTMRVIGCKLQRPILVHWPLRLFGMLGIHFLMSYRLVHILAVRVHASRRGVELAESAVMTALGLRRNVE